MNRTTLRCASLFAAFVLASFSSIALSEDPPAFKLLPAVAVEAEDFAIDSGWHVVKFGEGNYAVDIIGFSHTGGERFLSTDAADKTAVAHKDITIPVAGA